MPSRREVLATGLCLLAPRVALAQRPRFAVDWQGSIEEPAIAAALARQIALIEALPIDPKIIAFFAEQPIRVDTMPGSMSRIAPDGVHFERRAVPASNPVALHEMLHRYHLLRLPGGYTNQTVIAFYQQARASRLYPAGAYMLSHPIEFFAMTATTILYGRQSRPPFSRAEVARKSPDLFRWIVGEFGLRT